MMTPLQVNQDLQTTWEHALSALRISPPVQPSQAHHPGVAFGRAAFGKVCRTLVLSTRDDTRTNAAPDTATTLGAALATRYDLTGVLNTDTHTSPMRHRAWTEAVRGPRARTLVGALLQTHAIAREAKASGIEGPWRDTTALHPTSVARASHRGRCGDCAWAVVHEDHTVHCQQAARGGPYPELHRDTAACYRHEERLTGADCLGCGACCRGGFDRVAVEASSSIHRQYSDWIIHEDDGAFLPRPGGQCVALTTSAERTWPCSIYTQRPRSCRDFEVGGEACLLARRRMGISHD